MIASQWFDVEVDVQGAGAREEAFDFAPVGGLARFGVGGIAGAGTDSEREVDVERVAGADRIDEVGPGRTLVAVEGDLPGGEEVGGGAGEVDGEIHRAMALLVVSRHRCRAPHPPFTRA